MREQGLHNAETTLSNKWRLARFHAITTLNKAVTYFLGELALARKRRYIFFLVYKPEK